MNTVPTMAKKEKNALDRAAAAAGMSSANFLKRITGILRRRKCRDTSETPLFSAPVLAALSFRP